jgi:hypothetical protein
LHQVANYESLYRRVIRSAPQAALMSVAMFGFSTFSTPGTGNSTAQVLLPNPFHNSGAFSMTHRFKVGSSRFEIRQASYEQLV